ncbi:MAG: membrane protein insertase YidC [Pseudolabrys sp.]|nr:membrane protein insertase YidC [Pseudolabrys sp.]
MTDSKNTIIAIVLSAFVLIAWQYFYAMPQAERQKLAQQQSQPTTAPAPSTPGQPATATPGSPSAPGAPGAPPVPGQAAQPVVPGAAVSRDAALGTTPRIPISTVSLQGSISLKGGRIDDLSLLKFRETVDPKSPPIVLLSPSGSAAPFYAEFGWTSATPDVKVPGADTIWTRTGSGPLDVGKPVTLSWDNGGGLEFRRTIVIDDKFLFTIKDEVVNKSDKPVSLYPYGLISRHGTPKVEGYYILHEGLVGVLGDKLQEVSYSSIEEKKVETFDTTNGWLGITDKYWAAALLPDTKAHIKARFSAGATGAMKTYQTDYLQDAQTIAQGSTGAVETRLFAGAKEVRVVDGYEKAFDLNRFDLLIDWGWFYFITKPLFLLIDWLFHLFGNFGVAILAVTVLIKIAFFPLANKSYASMAKMKAVQPQMLALRERYPDDKAKQQQELMALYKKEKINPLAGCLPILVQIPVFFSLYKVLFVTIEMRHAPFFGWIKDLSALDPTNLFSLFGLLPEPSAYLGVAIGSFLHLGIWPLIMGITMWAQMKLNPAPPDPTQKMIFDWMPLIFTFMLASFPAGLVIYWAWNNSLSVAQQSYIMRKHGTKIELWDNVKEIFVKKKTEGKKT